MTIVIRKARIEDKARVLAVEATATPNLRYLHVMFDHWVHDLAGELSVAELNGVLVGVAKFTILPDGSAWLEALRVSSAAQGKGVGKCFYQRFFELAQERQVTTMRMYTGVSNLTSKGLAERVGFRLAATYRGASYNIMPERGEGDIHLFERVSENAHAQDLILPLKAEWTGFMVMNRTFYTISPALCTSWVNEGKVFYDETSQSVLVLGARFQAEQALHIACLGGDVAKCLAFAEQLARNLAAPKLICLFPPHATALEQALLQYGFRVDPSDYIVMEHVEV